MMSVSPWEASLGPPSIGGNGTMVKGKPVDPSLLAWRETPRSQKFSRSTIFDRLQDTGEWW